MTERQRPERVPDLFVGMTPEERLEAEEALLRYFGLLLRVVDERLDLTDDGPPPTLGTSV